MLLCVLCVCGTRICKALRGILGEIAKLVGEKSSWGKVACNVKEKRDLPGFRRAIVAINFSYVQSSDGEPSPQMRVCLCMSVYVCVQSFEGESRPGRNCKVGRGQKSPWGKSPWKVSLYLFEFRESFQGEFPVPREAFQEARERFQGGQGDFPESQGDLAGDYSESTGCPLKTL